MLKHKAHLPIAHVFAGDVYPVEEHGAAIGLLQPRNNPEQTGLS